MAQAHETVAVVDGVEVQGRVRRVAARRRSGRVTVVEAPFSAADDAYAAQVEREIRAAREVAS